MYMPRKIPKHEYKPQGTDLCNPRKIYKYMYICKFS